MQYREIEEYYLIVSKLQQVSPKIDTYAAYHIDSSSGNPFTHFHKWVYEPGFWLPPAKVRGTTLQAN